jgi:hypothetical protein
MNDFGIVSLVLGIAFLIFAILVKPSKQKPHHEK